MSKPIYLKSDKKVLIVEDDPGILMALEFLIANEGYQYDKAENGIEAIKKIRKFHPDLIVLDIAAPGNNGYEVVQKIRKYKKYQDIRIVFLSAKGTESDKDTEYSSGGDYHLRKPFDNDELKKIIGEILDFE